MLRFIIAVLAVGLFADLAAADPRSFARDDYLSYFSTGRFDCYAASFNGHCLYEVLSNARIEADEGYVLRQSVHSLQAAPNYNLNSSWPFYKIASQLTEDMTWDEAHKAFVYVLSDRDFEEAQSTVWESRDKRIEISKDDAKRGPLRQFYIDADKLGAQDAKALDAKFRAESVGAWSLACAYIKDKRYDVECRLEHQSSHRIEHYFYRKLDLVS